MWISVAVVQAADKGKTPDAKQGKPAAAKQTKPKSAAKDSPKKKDAPKKTSPDKPAAKTEKPKQGKPGAQKPSAKKANVVVLKVKGSFPEGPKAESLFGELGQSLSDFIQRLDQAAKDKSVRAVVLRIEGAGLGRGKVHEIREAIARFRKTGKPIYARLTSADAREYLVAAACDEVTIAPAGMLAVVGVRAEVTFYKGLLDKLGIKADMLQMGKYKGAGEPYTRTGMSPELRENIEGIVDDTYEDLVAVIAKDRGIDKAQVKKIIDDGLLTAAAARKAKLVDSVVYADQFEEDLKKKLKVDELKLVADYKKKKVDTDFSGLTGLMKMMNMMFGGSPTAQRASKSKKIAVVYAVGMIVPGKSATSLFGGKTLGSTTLIEALRKADKDKTVRAIVLRIDSPGGSALASDLIWREITRIKKPVIASMGDVAGSGGYYIAMGADKILAEPGTVTGSIGVIGGKLATAGLFEKVGITTDVVSRGKISGILSSDRPFTPEERSAMMRLMQDIYVQFVDKAAQGRKMPREKLEGLAGGRIYSGRMAVTNGLVDRTGTLRDALAEAKRAAGIRADEKIELLILPKPGSIFEQLFGDLSASTSMASSAAGLVEHVGHTDLLRRLFREPALTLMPYRLELK